MLLLERQTSATTDPCAGAGGASRAAASRQGAPVGRVQLRLRAGGQVFDLPPVKATIGSSPRCNVRIEQPGVQPLHCLISETPDGLRIRNWVGDTTLNGKPFEESALAIGDCLSLGAIELEIINPLADTPEQPTAKEPVVVAKHDEQVRAGRDRARARGRRLLETLRRERAAQSEVRRQVVSLQESHLDAISEQNALCSKLEGSVAELAAAREQLGHLQMVEAARCELAERNEQLGFELGELSARVNELTQDQSEKSAEWQRLAGEYAALQDEYQQVVDENGRLRREADQLANQRSTSDEQYRQLAEQHSQLQSEFDRLVEGYDAVDGEREQLSEINSRLQNDVLQLANEKAAADDVNRQMVAQQGQLQSEVDRLSTRKHELEVEREGLRRHIDALVNDARTLAGERGSLADERTELLHERGELLQQNEALRARIGQLNEENSAMAVAKLTLAEERDALNHEVVQLHTRLASLGEENASLAAAKATLAEDQAHLVAERKRLEELEREMSAAVAGRESTSAELYRALLQLSELQEREEQSKAAIEACDRLSKEHNRLHEDAEKLKEEVNRLSEERASIEEAWEALSAEATTVSESYQRLSDENAQLFANLEEARRQLEEVQREQTALAEVTAELEQERARRQQAEAEVVAAIAEGERRLEEQERRFAEESQSFAEQSNGLDGRLSELAEQSKQLVETIDSLERQLVEVSDARDTLLRSCDESQVHLADSESCRIEQSQRIAELESQLSEAEGRAARLAEEAAKRPTVNRGNEGYDSAPQSPKSEADGGSPADDKHPVNDAWRNTADENEKTREPAAWSSNSSMNARKDASPFGDDDGSQAGRPVQADVVADSKSAEMPGQESFIERYSHLFKEDDDAEVEKSSPPNDLAAQSREVAARKSFVGGSTSNGGDDESIEQYMAKLLQRVRGETPVASASPEATLDASLADPSSGQAEQRSASDLPSLDSFAISDEHSSHAGPVESTELAKRKPMPMADLDALRALANETARRAITWHDLGKLRRKAVTKMIVATLAGMTGLWLMLDAPEWHHLQFISACGLFAVAAYWAAETYRTFANLLKVGSHDRPGARSQGIETFGEPALPIDVEDQRD